MVVLSHALNHTYEGLLPILYPSIISEFNFSYGLVGMLSMGYRLSSGSLQLMMGFLARFVRRKMLLGLGMIWQCAANSFVAVSQGFGQILLGRSLAGVGSSSQHPTGSSYIAETFSKEKVGRALGINLVASQIGNFLAPFVGSLLLTSLGWRGAILAFSIPGLMVGIAFLFINESKRSRDWSGTSSLSHLSNGLREVLRNRVVLGVMVLETVMAFRMGVRDFLPSYFIRNIGMTAFESGMSFTIFVASGIPGPYFLGYLSYKFEKRKVIVLSMSAAAAFYYLLSHARSSLQVLSVLIPMGFVCQGIGGVIQAFVADSTIPENRDLIYGIYFTLSFGLGSFSPVILGYIADSFGFGASFVWVSIVSFMAVIFAATLLRQWRSD